MLFGCLFFLLFEAMYLSFFSSWSRRFDWISDASVLSLATLISVYCSAGWNRSSFVNKSLNHVAFLEAKVSATYSTSVNDKATVV